MQVCVRLRWLVYVQFFLLFVACTQALAETADRTSCSIGVRLIEAKNTESRNVDIQSSLSDLAPQLKALPYNNFQAVAEGTKEVSLMRQADFLLACRSKLERYAVSVTPHDLIGNKVRLTINWTGPRGEELVSTKMKVATGQSVVLGADGDTIMAPVISIRTECK